MTLIRYEKDYNVWCIFGSSNALIIGNIVFEIPVKFDGLKRAYLDMFKPEKERMYIKFYFFRALCGFIHKADKWEVK